MHRVRALSIQVASVLALALVGCSSSSGPETPLPGHCANVAGGKLSALIDEYPLDLLSEDIRSDLAEALQGASRICLVADGEVVSCNAGGGPKPDMRRCCRFVDEPEAAIFGVARKIGVSRGGEQVVSFSLDPELTNAAIDRQCDVPTCTNDRAAGTASLVLKGTVRTKEGAVDFQLPVTLDRRLTLGCEN